MGEVFTFGSGAVDGDAAPTGRIAAGRGAIRRRLRAARGPTALIIVTPAALAGVNRIYDHETGDELLAATHARLTAAAAPDAVVARLSGAKFAVIADAPTAEAAREAATRLVDALAAAEGGPEPDARAGVAWGATAAEATENGEALISAALGALDKAKADGPEVELAIADHAARREEMGLARFALDTVRAGGACIALQPVVSSGGETRLMFSEALIRVAGPDGANVPAGRFMPVLNRLNLTEEVDVAVLRLAYAELVRDPSRRISVNLSDAAIRRRRWPEVFAELAAAEPDATARLIVEVAEEAALSRAGAASALFALVRGQGAALALDDFGAGRTSFSHLRDFRFDMVKIDGGYVTGVEQSADNQMLISALVAIARQFDMTTIAEFVETPAEAEALRALGVDGFQGYLFGRPALVRVDGRPVAHGVG